MDDIALQLEVCQRYNAVYCESPKNLKLGIAENVKQKIFPINGLRIRPEGDTTGWYIWAGQEFSTKTDFFSPLHIAHLHLWCPEVIPYLGLSPGWRFLLAPDYIDVWQDLSLLKQT